MVKQFIRNTLTTLGLDLTKNLKYDRLTNQIMSKVIRPEDNCIDVGCHKGEMLDLMLHLAPNGHHLAFEPIPALYKALQHKYTSAPVTLSPCALSNTKGTTTFNYVKNAPAYSGIMKRRYDVKNPEIEEINVKLDLLDSHVDATRPVKLIKIDVEGAEYGVLKGGIEMLKRDKPYVVFEFGLGASDFYHTTPEMIYGLLVGECGLKISNLNDWIKGAPPLTIETFRDTYEQSKEYYFLAHP